MYGPLGWGGGSFGKGTGRVPPHPLGAFDSDTGTGREAFEGLQVSVGLGLAGFILLVLSRE